MERLKNITKMFNGKEEEHQELQKVEKLTPSEKLKRTFRKYELTFFCLQNYNFCLDSKNLDHQLIKSTKKEKKKKEKKVKMELFVHQEEKMHQVIALVFCQQCFRRLKHVKSVGNSIANKEIDQG